MTQPNETDILARPGANDQVLDKKVLLAVLACAEAERLSIMPDAAFIGVIQSHFLDGLQIADDAELDDWLNVAGIEREEFQRVMQDFATVVAVEAHYAPKITSRVELHRRLVNARMERIASME